MAVEQIQVYGELLESDCAAFARVVASGDDSVWEILDGKWSHGLYRSFAGHSLILAAAVTEKGFDKVGRYINTIHPGHSKMTIHVFLRQVGEPVNQECRHAVLTCISRT